METVENKYITVAYKPYTAGDDEKELFEEINAEHPSQFTSGLGTMLKSFENQITVLSKGDRFDFTIPADEAYRTYDEQHVFDLPKNIFEIGDKFGNEHVIKGNTVPLMTGDGQYVNASAAGIKSGVVVVDLNHPLAGADPIFGGEVIESRFATNEEIQELVKMVSGEGRGCRCDSCDSDYGDDCGCGGEHYH